MVRIEVHGQRLARLRMDGGSLGDWKIRGEGILGRRCLCGTVSTPKGHRQSVRTGDVNRDWIIGRIRELEASAQARVVTQQGNTPGSWRKSKPHLDSIQDLNSLWIGRTRGHLRRKKSTRTARRDAGVRDSLNQEHSRPPGGGVTSTYSFNQE